MGVIAIPSPQRSYCADIPLVPLVPDAPQQVQQPETNTNTTSNQPSSRGKTIDDELDAEDAAEVAKKDQAKAQSAAAHGKDVDA